jgi:protein-disulfide isomerase
MSPALSASLPTAPRGRTDGASRAERRAQRKKDDIMAQDPYAVALTPPVGAHDHVQGPDDAPLTLVQYGDYECPYTRKSIPIVHGLQRELGDRLRFVYRHFPLTQIHPHALHAAEAAEAAAAQGRFWPLHEHLFAHQHELEDGQLVDHARAVGLDTERVARELAAHAHRARVQADLQSGLASGVQGTPTFFINGARHVGPYDLETLLAALTGAHE